MPSSSCADVVERLRRQLAECEYPGYVYGYPHKKAYRSLSQPQSLAAAWADEDREHLFAYVHVPFCSQRCSFCNLFTYVPGDEAARVSAYLAALEREMSAYTEALGRWRFRRLYIGGGTPTFFSTAQLRRLVGALRMVLGIDPVQTQGCIEASPETLDADKIAVLRELGFQRLSLGVQSFVEAELEEVNRRFDFALHRDAIARIGAAGFPHFNIDLIYGLPGQSSASWEHSLQVAVDSPATSLFLYPLYVRPLTGLGARRKSLDAPTPAEMARMYDAALARLATAGFRQVTMRQFRRDADEQNADEEYRCQQHGMLGLGAGARSYTTHLHYSTPWRMVARNIRSVVEDYILRMEAGDTTITHGFILDEDERRRRFIIQSLLYNGLCETEYVREFARSARADFAEIWEALLGEGCVRAEGGVLRLTPRGVRHADIVGQLFFSDRVRDRVDSYEYDA